MTLVRWNSDQDGRARLNLSPSDSAEQRTGPASALSNFKAFEKHEIVISNESHEELALIKWRSATQFPISKILFYKALNRKRCSEGTVFQVAIQSYVSTLQELPNMPLFNVLYLARQAFSGFQVLFDRFGGFALNSSMIFINKSGKCKVWCHSNVEVNKPQSKLPLTELQFKNSLVSVLQSKCLKSLLTQQFFEDMFKKEKLSEAISYIKVFCRVKGIIASSNIPYGHSSNKKSHDPQDKFCKSYQGPEKKVPQFILDLRRQKQKKDSSSGVSQNSKFSYQSGYERRKRKLTIMSIKSEGVFRINSPKIDEQAAEYEAKFSNNKGENGQYRPRNKTNTIKRTGEDVEYTININTPTTQDFDFKLAAETREDMFFLKHPKESNLKSSKDRKLSYQDQVVFKERGLKRKTTLQNQQKRQVIIQSPGEPQSSPKQQNLEVPIKNMRPPQRSKTNIIRQTIQNSPHLKCLMRYTNEKQEDIIEKNGWLKRINSLNVEDFRGTVYSNSDGQEQFAEHMLMNNIKLELLDQLGTQLKGSILQHQ